MPLRTGRGDDAPRSNHAVPESRIAEWWHIVASPAAASRELVRSGLSAKYSVVNYDRLPAAAKVVARRLYRTWAEKSNPPDFPPSHPTSHRVTCPSCRKDAPVSIPLTAYNKLPKTGTVDISKVVIYGPHRDDDGAWCARMGRRISTLPNPKSSKWVAAWGVRCATCRHGKITHGRGCGVSDCPCTQFVPDEAFMASLSKKNPTTRGRGFHLFLVGLTNGGEVHVGGPYADRLTADLAKGTWKTGTNYRRLAEAERNARWGWKAQGAK
jgi:hypothetical protein